MLPIKVGRLGKVHKAKGFEAFGLGGGEAPVFFSPAIDGLLGNTVFSDASDHVVTRGACFDENFFELL